MAEKAPEDWPGATRDDELIRIYQQRLRGSLGRVNSRQLVSDFYKAKPLDPLAWMDARDQDLLRGESVRILEDLYYEAGWLGWCTARHLIGEARGRRKAPDVAARVDWGGWVPGDADAAKKLLGDKDIPGLQDLLDKRSVTIKGIEDTRYKDLASILARGVANGDSMETVAGEIVDYLKVDAEWADTVARTETRSAVTQASLDSYRDASISQKEWLTAWDEACDICSGAQDMGPVDIDEDFGEAGDGPPGHPNCLCVVLPVISAAEEELELTEIPLLSDEETAKRYAALVEEQVDRKESDGQPTTAALYRLHGIDELKPLMGTSEDLEKVEQAGGIRMYRGVRDSETRTAQEIVADFAHGDTHFAGYGWGSNGTYMSNAREIAEGYAKEDGKIMEFVLKPETKLLDVKDPEVQEQFKEWQNKIISNNTQFSDVDAMSQSISASSDIATYALEHGYAGLLKVHEYETEYVLFRRDVLVMLR